MEAVHYPEPRWSSGCLPELVGPDDLPRLHGSVAGDIDLAQVVRYGSGGVLGSLGHVHGEIILGIGDDTSLTRTGWLPEAGSRPFRGDRLQGPRKWAVAIDAMRIAQLELTRRGVPVFLTREVLRYVAGPCSTCHTPGSGSPGWGLPQVAHPWPPFPALEASAG